MFSSFNYDWGKIGRKKIKQEDDTEARDIHVCSEKVGELINFERLQPRKLKGVDPGRPRNS